MLEDFPLYKPIYDWSISEDSRYQSLTRIEFWNLENMHLASVEYIGSSHPKELIVSIANRRCWELYEKERFEAWLKKRTEELRRAKMPEKRRRRNKLRSEEKARRQSIAMMRQAKEARRKERAANK